MSGESLTNKDSLPDDVVFAILVQFPPRYLHNEARLVCRQWYRIINSPDFIRANLQHSPPGLLIQYWCYDTRHSVFVAMQQGRIKISEFNYKFNSNAEFNCRFNSYAEGSCNGLVVDKNPTGVESIYHVVNPTTEQRYALPPIPHKVEGVHHSRAIMAYAAASNEYKVLLMYVYSCYRVQCCAILTLGVDRDWRRISTKQLCLSHREIFTSSLLVAGGFIYWTEMEGASVLSLNVDTEVSTRTPVPKGYEKRSKYYLSTGSCLTMLVACSKLSWEVWELKPEESGEWVKLFKIDVKAQKWRLKKLVAECSGNFWPIIHNPLVSPMILKPVGWLNYGEVLVLHSSNPSRVCFLYNVRTQEIDSFELNHNFKFPMFGFHRNDLNHNFMFGFHRNSLVQLVF